MNSFYIARQPILTASECTYGYELLFRSSKENAFDPSVDGNAATSHVVFNAIVELGLDNLVGDGLAFINLTDRFLAEPTLLDLLPVGRCVLEVLETVEVTDEVLAGVHHLRDQGHIIALDDFEGGKRFESLLSLADIIKYDITQHSMESLAEFREIDRAAGRRSLVERVETRAEFEALSALGFDYFQGYFFAKPRMLSGAKLPQNRVALMQLLAEVNNPDSSIEDVAEIVGRDVALGVKTLKYVNSPINGLHATVTSIQHATVLLGRAIIRNWVTLLVMSSLDDKPSELIKLALTRARFCQLMAEEKQLDGAKYFTLGLLSLLPVFMDQTLEEALSSVSVNADMSEELVNRVGDGGRMLEIVERMESDKEVSVLDDIDLIYGQIYQNAVVWSEETSSLVK